MTFKYRFILSFVLLEIFFIALIVSLNFVAITDSSNKLIKDSINSKVLFLQDLVKIPLSIYDLATLDNLLEKTNEHKIINSVVIMDAQDNVLSSIYNFHKIPYEKFIKQKENKTYETDKEVFEVKHIQIKEEDINLGSMYLVFDISENKQFIQKNKDNTLILIFIEILISTFLSYLIGSKLTKMLTNLSNIALDIGENKNPKVPYLDKKDEIGILSNSLDKMQTDLINRTEELKRQKTKLEELSIAKDEFLANMSHELKTPLNSVNIISSVMIKNKLGNLNEKDIKNLSVINNSGNDLLVLINDILDVSKLEAGEIDINTSNININSFFQGVYEDFEIQTKQKELDFILECKEDFGFMHTDDTRLKQILKNLLSNALKFTKKGEIKISINTTKENIFISVKDTGIGIPEEKIETIFDRFKQVDGTTTRTYGGTGLGLSISRELAKLLGGDIQVESEVGKGSIFKVSIKRNDDLIDYLAIEKEKRKKEKKDETIVIFDNDPLNFINLTIDLKKEFHVIILSSFDMLLKSLKNDKSKQAIVDLSNLEINEIEKLKEFKDKIICIIDENSLNKKLIQKSFHQCILKPFDIQEVKNNMYN